MGYMVQVPLEQLSAHVQGLHWLGGGLQILVLGYTQWWAAILKNVPFKAIQIHNF